MFPFIAMEKELCCHKDESYLSLLYRWYALSHIDTVPFVFLCLLYLVLSDMELLHGDGTLKRDWVFSMFMSGASLGVANIKNCGAPGSWQVFLALTGRQLHF